MKTLPLFPDLPAVPCYTSLAKARDLVERVDELANVMDETFHDKCEAAASRAQKMGAHSVARVVRWLKHSDTLDKYGYDFMHWRAEDAAMRWLARQERKALP